MRFAFCRTLRKSNFIEAGISLNSIQFNSVLSRTQEKLEKCDLKWLMELCLLRHPIWVLLYFLRNAQYISTTLLTTGRNLRKVEFT